MKNLKIQSAATFLKGMLCVFILTSCITSKEKTDKKIPQAGDWLGKISLNDSVDMPFNFEVKHLNDSAFSITIKNGEERIVVTDIVKENDSVRLNLPVFGNYLVVYSTGNQMVGSFHNPDAEDYELPFMAQAGVKSRFEIKEKNCCDINEKWRVKFNPNSKDSSNAIAYFKQVNDTLVTATIMTETGDYRYLQGVLSGEHLRLSTFDGAHLFYFDATIESGQKISGLFYSGRSFMEPWIAYRDDDFELRNADSLTFIKEGAADFSFAFPTSKGDTIRLSDTRFKDKPVMVQIMGSWCPNCMDESRFFKSLYAEYHDKGLEIVGLTFERARNKMDALDRAEKMQEDLQLPYPILMAGYTREDKAANALPMLNHIMSYPTTVFLNKNHEVVKIHTGFAGPGTPVYKQYVQDTKLFVQQLIDAQ